MLHVETNQKQCCKHLRNAQCFFIRPFSNVGLLEVMLSLISNSSGQFCDGTSRRNFLKIVGLAMGGLALPDLSGRPQYITNGHKPIRELI